MQKTASTLLAGLDPHMRPVLIAAERIYKAFGRPEGVTVTSGLDGVHSAGSLHYYGKAIDLRVRHPLGLWSWSERTRLKAVEFLRSDLGGDYDVVLAKTHIHVEYDPK